MGEKGVCGLGDEDGDDGEEEIAKMFMSDTEQEDRDREAGHEQVGPEEVAEDHQDEEGIAAKGIHSPEQPTRREIEDHELAHIPFRQWCVHCQKGRGVPTPPSWNNGGE